MSPGEHFVHWYHISTVQWVLENSLSTSIASVPCKQWVLENTLSASIASVPCKQWVLENTCKQWVLENTLSTSIASVPCKQWVLENTLSTSIASIPCRQWVLENTLSTSITSVLCSEFWRTLCPLVSHQYHADHELWRKCPSNTLCTGITSLLCKQCVMEKVPLQHFVYWYHITTVQTMRHGESAPPTLCVLVSHHYCANNASWRKCPSNTLCTGITSLLCKQCVMEKVPLQHFVYWYHITTVQTMRHGESAPPTLCSLVSHHYYACWVMVKVPLPHFAFWCGWLCETHFLLLCGFLNGKWLKLVSIFLSCCFTSSQFYL